MHFGLPFLELKIIFIGAPLPFHHLPPVLTPKMFSTSQIQLSQIYCSSHCLGKYSPTVWISGENQRAHTRMFPMHQIWRRGCWNGHRNLFGNNHIFFSFQHVSRKASSCRQQRSFYYQRHTLIWLEGISFVALVHVVVCALKHSLDCLFEYQAGNCRFDAFLYWPILCPTGHQENTDQMIQVPVQRTTSVA